MTKTIACDFDSNIANTREVAFKLMFGDDHEKDPSNGPWTESWEAPIEIFGADRFLSAMWHSWTLRPLDVPILEDNIPEKMSCLQDHGYAVDIVTAHANQRGITKGKKKWLDYHNIEYDDFVSVPPTTTKASMGYDYYLDDKPSLPRNVNNVEPNSIVYLRDWPYNENADGSYIRTATVGEAIDDILNRND